jgi:hypothetical protein
MQLFYTQRRRAKIAENNIKYMPNFVATWEYFDTKKRVFRHWVPVYKSSKFAPANSLTQLIDQHRDENAIWWHSNSTTYSGCC